MWEQDDQETTREGLPPDPHEGFSETARRWHEELKQEEDSIAPWLNLEWTGENMDAKRG